MFRCYALRCFMSAFFRCPLVFLLTNWNSKHVSCGVTAVDLYLSISRTHDIISPRCYPHCLAHAFFSSVQPMHHNIYICTMDTTICARYNKYVLNWWLRMMIIKSNCVQARGPPAINGIARNTLACTHTFTHWTSARSALVQRNFGLSKLKCKFTVIMGVVYVFCFGY